METIQVMIDAELLQTSDRAAKKAKLNRSELVRLALREHLKRLQVVESGQRDESGYKKLPQAKAREETDWEAVAAWPEA
jgi:metal-responsive CopG/Arc/MetJ family transcriptional regulator